MATLSITVPDALVPRIAAAARVRLPDVTGNAPGQTPLADGPAVRAAIIFLIRQVVRETESHAVRTGQENAVTQAAQDAWNATAGIS